ncbi:MAG: glycoside hydrolase family 65 protein [Actinobacteria bacterium]|nr:glycoside hydrolase family 65 protein [Actinomycetota bacterium]
MTTWSLVYDEYLPEQEGLREALCTLGNGYVATRGAAPESTAGDVHCPGTYIAGLYNRLETDIAGETIENEDLVNAPNWLVLAFAVLDDGEPGPWFDIDDVEILGFRQELDIKRALLIRHVEFRDTAGRRTTLTQRRFVHMEDQHLAGLETTIEPVDWSGRIVVRSAIDGGVENLGVERYRELAHDHHDVVERGEVGDGCAHVTVETTQSHIRVGVAARTRVHHDGERVTADRRYLEQDGLVGHDLTFDVREGEPVTVEKIAAVHTTQDRAVSEPGLASRERAQVADGFFHLLERHTLAWDHLWDRFAIDLGDDGSVGRAQMVLRLHILHLLQTVSPNTIDLDVGVPARGLHGEAYRGHIFWDELFIFPFLNLRLPVLTRALLHYRHRRLPAARRMAAEEGYDGAMFPWQSGSDGREESQRVHLNPRSGRWIPDHSRLQRHINHAIAFNVWQYWQVTQDREFLRFHGAEMMVEISRFLASLATYERADDRYHVYRVMGPDEYHEKYPDAPEDDAGLDDNAYTNVMTVWVLMRTREVIDGMAPAHREELVEQLGLRREELDHWDDITRKMYVPFHGDRIISQFEGYEDLEELDWDAYRERYGDIQRMDRILKAEEDTPDRYKLSKQADVLMLFYLLSEELLAELFERLGYGFDDQMIDRNVDYYLERTSHGSTLSRVVHSWVLTRLDRERSWEFFADALESDVSDIQGGTTEEGIHLGAMSGTVDLVQRAYGGVIVRDGVLRFDPALPRELHALGFSLHFRGHRMDVRITPDRLEIHNRPSNAEPVRIAIRGDERALHSGETVTVEL